jgi:hydrogenase/urease accessory protein HupE
MQITPMLRSVLGFSLFLLFSAVAQAHPGHEGGHGDGGLSWDFVGSTLHAMGGLDHLLLMVALGLGAVLLGGRRVRRSSRFY